MTTKFPDFPIACLRFKAGSLGLQLPDYAGSVLRGGFGMALRRVSLSAWDLLFGDNCPDKLFVPYMLIPPLRGENTDPQVYNAGDTFEFELRLFGVATEHYQACIEAFNELGKFGLGRGRGRFALLGACCMQAKQTIFSHHTPPKWVDPQQLYISGMATDWLQIATQPVNALQIKLLTPLRLKHDDELLGQAPAFQVLWQRLYARIALATHNNHILETDQRQALTEQAATIQLTASSTHWFDWSRYSARQKTEMRFGGLLGDLRYHGNLTAFLPFLKLGSVLGLGGKTTFGLGWYQLQTIKETTD